MKEIILNISLLSGSFLTLFGMAELLFHKLKVRAELTRKFVHLGTGILAMLFPVFLTSHWQVLLMCTSFMAVLALSKKFDFLKSINHVERKTHGSILFPVVVYGCFASSMWVGDFVFYYLPILILAISDPLAALVGKRFPIGKFRIANHTKTLSGSMAFFVSALGISFLSISSLLDVWSLEGFLVVCLITAASCIAEAVSKNGWDNFTIPVAVSIVLFNLNNQVLC